MGKPHGPTVRQAVETWVKLMAPFAPHVCEELWERLGKEGFVSLARWPEPDEAKIDLEAEEGEELVRAVLEDLGEVIKVLKVGKPRRVCLYVASPWKWKAYLRALETAREGRPDIGAIMRSLMQDPELKARAKEVASLVKQLVKDIMDTSPEERERRLELGRLDEMAVLKEASAFLAKEVGAEEVLVFREDDPGRYDPKGRAKLARPYRPAIYVE